MGSITPDLTGIVNGATPDAEAWTNPFNTIINEFNGNISNENIASGAAIDQSKIATSTLGYAERTSDFNTTTVGSDVDVTSLTVTVTVPSGGRRIEITAFTPYLASTAAAGTIVAMKIKEGATQLTQSQYRYSTANYEVPQTIIYSTVATAGSHTYKVAVGQDAAGTISHGGGATLPSFILVKLI